MPTSVSSSASMTARRSQQGYEKNKKEGPKSAAERLLIWVLFVMFLIGIYEPFRRRTVPLTAKTMVAEEILSLLSPLSRLSGYFPNEFCEKSHDPLCWSVGIKAPEIELLLNVTYGTVTGYTLCIYLQNLFISTGKPISCILRASRIFHAPCSSMGT